MTATENKSGLIIISWSDSLLILATTRVRVAASLFFLFLLKYLLDWNDPYRVAGDLERIVLQ